MHSHFADPGLLRGDSDSDKSAAGVSSPGLGLGQIRRGVSSPGLRLGQIRRGVSSPGLGLGQIRRGVSRTRRG